MKISLNEMTSQENSGLPPQGLYWVRLIDIEEMEPKIEKRQNGTERTVARLRFVYDGFRILPDDTLDDVHYRLTQVFPVYIDKKSRLLMLVQQLAPGRLQIRPDGSFNMDAFDTDDLIGYTAEAEVIYVHKGDRTYANVEILRSFGRGPQPPGNASPIVNGGGGKGPVAPAAAEPIPIAVESPRLDFSPSDSDQYLDEDPFTD